MRLLAVMILFLSLVGCGDGGGGGSGGGGGGGAGQTQIPLAISSPGTASFAENGTGTAYQATTVGGSGAPVTLTLGGADAGQFNLTPGGTLTFKSPPDFEKPTDSDRNNVYDVQLTASDGTYSAQLTVSITVTNVPDEIVVTRVGGAYDGGVFLAAVPGQKNIFTATNDGKIYLVDPSTRDQGSLYLSVPNVGALKPNQGGLLGIAAAPDYAASGNLYVFVYSPANNLEVRRYRRLSSTAGDPNTEEVILSIPVQRNSLVTPSLGGWIGFGPDGYLYLGTGDAYGGHNAQNLSSLLGKLLRIDVSRDDFPADPRRNYGIPVGNPFSGSGGAPEIFAYGFQDPHHGGFDGSNLFLDDAQHQGSTFQEINLIRPQDAGANYGWSGSLSPPAGSIPPVVNVSYQSLSLDGYLVGGYVYRGPSPQLAGQYLFYAAAGASTGVESVAASSLIQGITLTAPTCCSHVTAFDSVGTAAITFGEDADHNLYMLSGNFLYEIQLQ